MVIGIGASSHESGRTEPVSRRYGTEVVTLEPGDPAPAFALPDQRGNEVRLEDHRGHKVLVYFYPKADTPGCTIQSCAIRDERQELAGIGVSVLGISPDLPDAQLAFDEKFGLGFPLLSDPDHAVAEAWGAWGERERDGKRFMGIIRSSFLVDEDGRIERAWFRVRPEDTVPNAIAALSG
jgi:peroxiredoxin Q/BCP